MQDRRAQAARSKTFDRSVVRSSSEGHKLGQVCAKASPITQIIRIKSRVGHARLPQQRL